MNAVTNKTLYQKSFKVSENGISFIMGIYGEKPTLQEIDKIEDLIKYECDRAAFDGIT